MKSKSFNDQQTISINTYQNNSLPQFMPMRPSLIARDYSNEQKIKKISPLPQERFSQLSGNLIYSTSSYLPNEYQFPIRTIQQSVSPFESKRSLQDIITKIQKLELRSQKLERLEFRMDKLQTNFTKFQLKMENIETKSQQFIQGNENRMNLENCAQKNQDQMKQKIKNLITRQELQRQLIGLDSAFKTLIKEIKSTTNIQMREIHTKEKKTMIQMVASQISEKLQVFKSNFISQLTNKIENSIRQYFNSNFINKSILGIERQKFLGTTVSLKLQQQLHYTSNGVEKIMAVSQMKYFIDTQGYVLDSSCLYLLDRNNLKIRLSESHIDMLRKEGLLSYGNEGHKQNTRNSSSTSFNDK